MPEYMPTMTIAEYIAASAAGAPVAARLLMPAAASPTRRELRGRDTSLDEQERQLRHALRSTGRGLDPEIERLRERTRMQSARMRVKLETPPLGWGFTRESLDRR